MPKTTKHLKAHQFKKGQSGNPEGARAHNPVTKALKKLTIETYREVIELIMTGTIKDLEALAKSETAPAVQIGIAMSLAKAIKNGDIHTIERLAERIVGKIPDELNVNRKTTVEVIDKEMLKKAMAEIEADVGYRKI